MLYNIITPSKIPYPAGKYVILPNPNRITLIALSGIWEGDFFVLAPNWSPNFTECDRISDKFLTFLSGFELLLSECVLGYSFYLHFLTNEIVYNIPFPRLC